MIVEALDDADIGGQTVVESKFLPGYTWLAPQTVADAIGGQAGGSNGTVAPGLHGHGIIRTQVGDATLEPAPASTTIPAKAPATVKVTFQNQGDNIEQDVEVQVRLTAPGTKTATAKKSVDTTQAGAEATVEIPITTLPPAGTAGELTVRVGSRAGREEHRQQPPDLHRPVRLLISAGAGARASDGLSSQAGPMLRSQWTS